MDSNSNPSLVQPVANRYTDYGIPAPPLWQREMAKRVSLEGEVGSEILRPKKAEAATKPFIKQLISAHGLRYDEMASTV
jgi:hypothetical protein